MLTVRPTIGVLAPRSRLVSACAVLALLSLVSCASASAALNLTGTWSANYHCETGGCAGSDSPATDTLTQAEGSDVVTGSNATETISGTLTGDTFVFESSVGAYKAKATLTVAANGLTWSGPLEDSNGTKGTYTATRELTSGALSQLGEPSDCIGEAKEEVAKCGTSVPYGLSYAYQVQVSPDARNAYSVAVNGDLIEYSRNLANGSLTVIGCFSSLAKSEPACAGEHAEMEVAAVGQPAAIAISPDGASAYVISQLNNTVAEFSRNQETGLLTKIGCITEESTSSECATVGAKGLFTPYGITVSPEGENVYVASFDDEAVAEFKRDTETGVLTQLAAPNNCISEKAGSGCGTTTGVIGLEEAIGVAVSPDEKDVYVAAGAKSEEGDIAAFKRGAEGALEQLHGEEACISEKVTGCAKGEHIRGSEDLAISPDGKNVYANSYPGGASAVIELERNETTGALEQLASPNECVSTETLSGCTKAEGVGGPLGVAISPGGENVYTTSANENAVAAFKRGAEGALEQLSANPCVTENTSGCGSPEFNQRVGLEFARRLTVSPDGTNVYVAGQSSHAIVELARAVTPTVSGIEPNQGPFTGGTEVTIRGTGFSEGDSVKFGPNPASGVHVSSAKSLTATAPAGSGTVNVTVTSSSGTSATGGAEEYVYGRVGGLNLSGYCESLGDNGKDSKGEGPAVLMKEAVTGPEYAYNNWACVEPDGAVVPIAAEGPAPSMNNACAVAFPGIAAHGSPEEPNNAFTWVCYEGAPPPEGHKGGGEQGGGGGEPTAKAASLVFPDVLAHPLVVPAVVSAPVLAKTGNVAPVSGTVLVKAAGHEQICAAVLFAADPLRLGDRSDARNGERDHGGAGWKDADGRVLRRGVHPQAGRQRRRDRGIDRRATSPSARPSRSAATSPAPGLPGRRVSGPSRRARHPHRVATWCANCGQTRTGNSPPRATTQPEPCRERNG